VRTTLEKRAHSTNEQAPLMRERIKTRLVLVIWSRRKISERFFSLFREGGEVVGWKTHGRAGRRVVNILCESWRVRVVFVMLEQCQGHPRGHHLFYINGSEL
jgi:hypothetical protein